VTLENPWAKPVEAESKGLLLALAHSVSTSGRFPRVWFAHEHRRYLFFYSILAGFQIENPGLEAFALEHFS
jgi:hypothetical protein